MQGSFLATKFDVDTPNSDACTASCHSCCDVSTGAWISLVCGAWTNLPCAFRTSRRSTRALITFPSTDSGRIYWCPRLCCAILRGFKFFRNAPCLARNVGMLRSPASIICMRSRRFERHVTVTGRVITGRQSYL